MLEFYTNLNKSMFATSVRDVFKAYIHGRYIVFSPAIVDESLERSVTIYPKIPVVDLDVVTRELIGGEVDSWVGESLFVVKLSIKYSILYKIVVKNWLPTTHMSTLGQIMSVLLYRIGIGTQINFGLLCSTP